MQNKLIIVAVRDFEGQTDIQYFPDGDAAKAYILNMLKTDARELDAPDVPDWETSLKEFFRKFYATSGAGSIDTGFSGHEYEISFKIVPAEYRVSDDEFYTSLDSYCNSGRTYTDFRNMAERISGSMHRYCQNELWKFIKKIIAVFASGPYDERNEAAHNQAQEADAVVNA